MSHDPSCATAAKPFPQSFWFEEGILCAGCYPGDLSPTQRDAKLRGLLRCGIRLVINLTEPGERGQGGKQFEPYDSRLKEFAAEAGVSVGCKRLPIPDASVPRRSTMKDILDALDDAIARQVPTYVHCWGGHGRTGMVVACYFVRQGSVPEDAIHRVLMLRSGLPKNHDPFEPGQKDFVRSWSLGE